jgi:hypothetical protein
MARALVRLSCCVFCAALGACGGTDDGRPNGDPPEETAPIDQCALASAYEFQNVVNFEPHMIGDRVVLDAACDAATPCTFYFNYDVAQSPPNPDFPDEARGDCLEPVDESAVVFTKPLLRQQQFPGDPLPGGRCNSESSGLHVIAENVGMCYGPDARLGWGAGFDVTFSPVLDASEWDGLAIWVKNASNAQQAVNLSVADPYTSGDTFCRSMDPMPGEPPTPDSKKCDAFGTAVTMDENWTFIPARFSSMRQKGFGVPSELGHLDTTSISRVQLLMNAGSWDFYIDDIALYRTRE